MGKDFLNKHVYSLKKQEPLRQEISKLLRSFLKEKKHVLQYV